MADVIHRTPRTNPTPSRNRSHRPSTKPKRHASKPVESAQARETQLQQLAARVEAAREDERASLARELHDELGQTLTAIKLELARAAAVLTREQVGNNVVNRLQSLVGLSEIGIATVKRITTNLRPPTLDHLGLAEAIRWEAAAFRGRTGLRCRVDATDEPTGLTTEQEIAVFRILQEALTNIVRHAHASSVVVTLVRRRGAFELRIRDNGRGITDTQARNPRAIGLLGMRERAMLVGGTVDIAGTRGRGTLVTVHAPLPGETPRGNHQKTGPGRTR